MSAPHFLARESQCLLQCSALPRPPLQSSISSRNPKQLSSWLSSAPHGNLIFFEWGNDHPGKPIHRSVKMPTLCFIYSHLDLWMERAFCSHAIICKQKNEVKITDTIPLVYPRLWHFFFILSWDCDFLFLWQLPLPDNCFPHLLDSCFTSSQMQPTKPRSIFISNLLSPFCSLIRQKEVKLEVMYGRVQGLEYWLSWETSHTLPIKIIYNHYQDLTQLAACQLLSQLFKD